MTTTIDITVPDLGDFDDVEVIEVLVKAGDPVAREDGLITLETDKASMDVPSPENGTIEEITAIAGDKVRSGDVIGKLIIEASDTVVMKPAPELQPTGDTIVIASPVKPQDETQVHAGTVVIDAPAFPADAVETSETVRQPVPPLPRELPPINEAGFSRAHASPSVRKLARELGVDLAQVSGSGAKSRILHDDVKAFVKAILTGQAAGPAGGGLPKTPSIDFSKFGEIETLRLTRIQKISGPRLQASWINLPHVTQHDLADITNLEARRQELKEPAKKLGISMTPLAFIIRAVVATLKEFPRVNSSLSDDGESLVLKKYIHIGFAVDTEHGLMVPVIRDADRKDVWELATELAELSAAARDGKLKTPQLQGASFTISSLGGIGGTAFTPIVNAPEVAILGVSRSSMQPVWNGSKFAPRLMLPLSLSYDHRVIDGATAARFTTFLGQKLSDVEVLLQATP